MKYTDAKEYLRAKLPDYLRDRGLSTTGKFRCYNPKHDDDDPSMSYDKKRQKCHCFGCKADYDIFDMIGIDYGLSGFNDQMKKAAEMYNVQIERDPSYRKPASDQTAAGSRNTATSAPDQKPAKDYFPQIRAAAMAFEGSPAETYINSRGISTETAARFTLGYDAAFRASTGEIWQSLVIPTGDMQHHVSFRNLDQTAGDRYEKRGSAALFNPKALNQTEKPLFIVEGEIDALSIIEAGGEAVGLCSKSNKNSLIEALKETRPAVPLVLALDADEPGQKAEAEISEALTELNIKHYRAGNLFGSDAKDANEALQKDREGFSYRVRNIISFIQEEIRKQYFSENSAKTFIPAFLEDIRSNQYNRPISSGFPTFDKSIGGGFRKGLYILGGMSSLGKTTLCLQMADQIAEAGHDVMIFSLEMSRFELMARTISRYTVEEALNETKRRDNAKTVTDILDGSRWESFTKADRQRIDNAIKRYEKTAERLIIHESIGRITAEDVQREVERHNEITGGFPFVLIDYLQIMKPLDAHMTDKQAVEANLTILKQLARKLPVLTISSLNRESYRNGGKNNGRINMTDLKESGGIEYSADGIIGLQFCFDEERATYKNGKLAKSSFDEEEEKKKDPRTIQSVILKNRNGAVYGKTDFCYIPQFNYFYEGTPWQTK